MGWDSRERRAENISISGWTMAVTLDRVFGNRFKLFLKRSEEEDIYGYAFEFGDRAQLHRAVYHGCSFVRNLRIPDQPQQCAGKKARRHLPAEPWAGRAGDSGMVFRISCLLGSGRQSD
ncbi:MAG: hypothetical protein WDM87_05100 [Terracidiphilus sp.]